MSYIEQNIIGGKACIAERNMEIAKLEEQIEGIRSIIVKLEMMNDADRKRIAYYEQLLSEGNVHPF